MRRAAIAFLACAGCAEELGPPVVSAALEAACRGDWSTTGGFEIDEGGWHLALPPIVRGCGVHRFRATYAETEDDGQWEQTYDVCNACEELTDVVWASTLNHPRRLQETGVLGVRAYPILTDALDRGYAVDCPPSFFRVEGTWPGVRFTPLRPGERKSSELGSFVAWSLYPSSGIGSYWSDPAEAASLQLSGLVLPAVHRRPEWTDDPNVRAYDRRRVCADFGLGHSPDGDDGALGFTRVRFDPVNLPPPLHERLLERDAARRRK